MRLLKVFASLAAVLAISLVGHVTPANAARQIEWQSLLPKLQPLKDPLANLTQEQRFDIETIQWARGLTKKQKLLVENQQGVEDAKKFEREFLQAGLDVEKLLARYRSWMAEVAKRQKLINTDLNGESVRMAGYLLPLEFSDEGVTDFLLVPYVGACIHVPPPPANQIVFVRLTKKFKVDDLFTAVWVSGNLKTKATSKALTLIDGTADVAVGYHIDGASAEIYRE
ncbi:MAG: DUF3299 domain-containing protein [Hyphomicrobiaceae bacterium]